MSEGLKGVRAQIVGQHNVHPHRKTPVLLTGQLSGFRTLTAVNDEEY